MVTAESDLAARLQVRTEAAPDPAPVRPFPAPQPAGAAAPTATASEAALPHPDSNGTEAVDPRLKAAWDFMAAGAPSA